MIEVCSYQEVIDGISALNWPSLTREELVQVAWAYYYFSIQFRENLEVACDLCPEDPKLQQLHREECDTDNLSPWPGVVVAGEKVNHDEFMRRLLSLTPISDEARSRVESLGRSYLAETRGMDRTARALTIASYEDGGLETVFKAILRAPDWNNPLLGAFHHFLAEHIRFDSDPDGGHGALSRHLVPDDRIIPAWRAFRRILVGAVPQLVA